MKRSFTTVVSALTAALLITSAAVAQSVCLPAPRLLTTMPMGCQAGTSVEVTISGDNFEDVEQLIFSHEGITAKQKLGENGKPIPNRFVVTVAKDCRIGIHEARVMTRLGVSTSRIFNVGGLPEATRVKPNRSLETAMPLEVDSICNAVMTPQAVDYYSFAATEGQRIVVDCGAKRIDSRLKPVLIVADDAGADLQVERRGGAIDFTVPETGKYIVKVHDLTFNGGSAYFYRLALRQAEPGAIVPRLPSVESVSSFSWPPAGLSNSDVLAEAEPNNSAGQSQKITLPCDIAGSFFPAADVDVFEFTAKKGEIWWVEVASERLGRPTDPSIVVQHVSGEGTDETVADVVELSDIPSPVKISSNGYSYDGPPYNAGSSDIIGKLEIKQDGLHRLQLRDLFGGTRNDPQNIYRLIVRKAAPDFALVGWALHMNLRNGDRNALSKPMALRGGTTMPIEVVVVRRDGFNGEIDLLMDNLPTGVTAAGLKIPAGKSRGIMLVSAAPNAPRGLTNATFYGKATIGGEVVTRPCRLASMQWPVPDAKRQIPSPRLLADVPVSVGGSEQAPITIAPAEQKVWEVTAGDKLTIPLVHSRRCEFSGANISLRTYGAGFERVPAFDAALTANESQVTLDTGMLKTPPGEYIIAFYGKAVAKYRYNLEAVHQAEAELKQLQQEAESQAADAKQKSAAVAAAESRLKNAVAKAKPKDIVDIIVSTPITIRVRPVEKAEQK